MLDSKIVGLIVDARRESGSRLDELTERERTVLGLIAAGRSNSAIARELVVTRRAVERHVASIFAKLELAESEAVNRRVLAALLFTRSAD
jgi:DNA-binding NarL/FixJ family response regulator